MNRVCLVGNLTRDPELRETGSGTPVCSLRIACNERAKINDEWTDRAHYFNVTVWGTVGERCAEYLGKGSKVAIDGRLQFREWETDGEKRNAVDIVADRVEFLGSRESAAGGSDEPRSEDDDFPF